MTQNLPRNRSIGSELLSNSRTLSVQLEEAFFARSLLLENSGGTVPLFSSSSKDYIKLENGSSGSYNKATWWTKAKQFWGRLLPGWRKSLALDSLYITIVLLANTIWILVTISYFKSKQGIYTLYEGSCSRASTTNSVLHVLINILSTVLLASSNYATSCLTSPTRTEVDRAHKKRKWLYIGIPNFKNLLWISWWRKPIVILLLISTWPLHVLWNSVVFKTIQTNQYAVLVVTHDFITSAEFDDNLSNLSLSTAYDYGFTQATFLSFAESLYNKSKNGSMDRLDNAECMKTYSQPIISNRRNLLLITNTTLNGSVLSYSDSEDWQDDFLASTAEGQWDAGAFICDDEPCDLEVALQAANNWTAMHYQIDFCLSEIVPEVCQIQLLLPILAIVVLCNFVKLLCVCSTIFTFKEPPLVVIGDALATFLDKKNDSSSFQLRMPVSSNPPRRWIRSACSDLMMTFILSSITLVATSLLLREALQTQSNHYTGQTLKTLGFGKVSPWDVTNLSSAAGAPSSLSLNLVILIVNSPQVVFTLLYLIFNRTITKMLSMHEWTKFVTKRRSLRVSQPSGIQRSTYWLHLPYRYSAPLIIMSSSMHWIISESFFLVRVAFYDKNGMPYLEWDCQSDQTDCSEYHSLSNIATLAGYSPEAMLTAMVLGGIMLLALLLLSFRKFESAIPLVGNNSWAISTVCNCPSEDEQAASKAVKWGAVSHPEGDMAGNCCLTSFEVETPIDDGLYTGLSLLEK